VRIFKTFEICANCKHYKSCLSNKNVRPYGTCEQFEFIEQLKSK